MDSVSFPVNVAPDYLNQSILPNWTISPFSINIGLSSNSEIEYKALKEIGSYGKQIGHVAEALEVVIRELDMIKSKSLSDKERDVLQIFLGDVAKVRELK